MGAKDGTFSGGEKRLLEIAASTFNSDRKVNLWRAFGMLDGHVTGTRHSCDSGVQTDEHGPIKGKNNYPCAAASSASASAAVCSACSHGMRSCSSLRLVPQVCALSP